MAKKRETEIIVQAHPAWIAFADAILQREALIARVGRGAPPREFAGLVIGDEELDALMAELPGMDGATPEEAGDLRELFAPRLADARKHLVEALENPDDQFAVVCWNAGLSHDEAEVLALLVAIELEPARQRLLAYVQDNVTLPRPTIATINRLFPSPHTGARSLAADGALRRSCLIQLPEEGPWGSRMVSVTSSLLWSVVDDASLDPDLPPGVEVFRSDSPGEGVSLLLVSGGNRTSRRVVAMAHGAGSVFLCSPFPNRPEEWRALTREAITKGVTVVLEYEGDGSLPPEARDWLDRSDQTNWVVASDAELSLESLPRRPWREAHAVDDEATNDEWVGRLGIERHGGHRLNQEQLRLVASAFPAADGDLGMAVRRLAGGHLDRLARRIRPSRRWGDVVLPSTQHAQIEELIARYRYRAKVYEEWDFKAIPSAGLVALFAGPSGTGKTLSAEIVAGELGLDMYKIDLSSVVSKYIGETEKNLERIFAAAGAVNVVLFFDEADAMFGKRSEVNDARDRYANIEVSYLLQRMESYDGLVILATNFKQNIDEAFLRRIHVAVDFVIPEEDERKAIWTLCFPDQAPTDSLDIELLARQFKLTGGAIRNAALAAAFLAASAETDITMENVILGIKREFQKIGRLRTKEEFGEYHEFVQAAT